MRALDTEWYRIVVTRKCSVASSSRATISGELLSAAGTWTGLGDEHGRQAIEKLTHARRQHLREPLEGIGQVALKGCAGDGFEDVPAQVERAQLRQREPGLDPLQHLAVEAPL